jgi:general stress protein YciG
VADDRTYIRVHDGMDDHPKIVGLSDGAFRLLMRSWSYCSRQLTDGRLPDAAWRDRGSAKARRELIDAGLAHLPGHACHHPECPPPPPKHVQMHDYLEHQRSAAEVAELKRKRAEAGSKGGKSRASAQANAKQVLEQTASKTQASTETETDTYLKTSVQGGSHVSRADATPPLYANRCKRHGHVLDPGPCGSCADVRQANAARPLTLVPSPLRRCIVHDTSFERVCTGCEADRKAAESA